MEDRNYLGFAVIIAIILIALLLPGAGCRWDVVIAPPPPYPAYPYYYHWYPDYPYGHYYYHHPGPYPHYRRGWR